MKQKEILLVAAILLAGAILNYLWAVISGMYAIPVGAELVIAAYCLIAVTFSLGMAELAGIGIIASALSTLSNPSHAVTVANGQIVMAGGFAAGLFNLVCEPVGIVVCSVAFVICARRIGSAAPLPATILATIASGLVYLLLAAVFSPALITSDPAWTGNFLLKVTEVAITNAVIVEVLFLLVRDPLRNAAQEKPA